MSTIDAEVIQPQPKAPPQPTQNLPMVMANDSGVLIAKSLDEAFRLATGFFRSGMLPKRYDSPEMVFTAMQFALELGLKPLTALRQIAVVNGTPALFGDLPLALVQASGKLAELDEYLITKEGRRISGENKNLGAEAWAAVFYAKRKGDPQPIERVFSLDDAKKANLLGSPTWKSYPQYMLKYRARSSGIKDKFADCINGVHIAEYDFNLVPDETSGKYVVDTGAEKKSGGLAAELAERLRGDA